MVKNGLNKYLKKLSIVVLSFNKQLSLKAVVNYWSNYPVELIVLDGSYKKINLIIKNEYNPNFKLRYYHYPHTYFDRIKKATDFITREYSLLSADDEIHLPRGVAASIKFLENNSEYNSSMGQCNICYEISNKLKLRKAYQKLGNVNITQIYNNMEDRIFHYFNDYVCATYYSIVRSQAWKKNVRKSFSILISCPFASERLFEFTNIACGKCYIHKNVTWIRNGINRPIFEAPGFKKYHNRSKTLKWWINTKNKSVQKEHDKIKKLLRDYGVKKESISIIFSQIFKEPIKQPLIIQIRQFLMNKKLTREIILIVKSFLNIIALKFLKRRKLKKIDDYLFLNKDEINIINKFIFEEQGLIP